MDRPSQKPPEHPGPLPEAGESPLSFPVEAPKLVGVEPGAGEPLGAPAEAASPAVTTEAASPVVNPLGFPVEAVPPLAAAADAAPPGPAEATQAVSPLAFPAEAAPPTDPPLFPPTAPPDPHAFHSPAEQLPYPVAELPGSVTAIPAPAPAPAPEPAPIPVTEAPAETPTGLLRYLPPVLTAVAALMTVAGCLLPLFRLQQHVSVRQRFFEAQLTLTETAWGSRIEIPGQDVTEQGGSPVGIPLILAVLVLAVAAFTAFARPGRGPGRWLIAAGAVFTAGVVITVGMGGPGLSALADGMDLEVTTEAGMWLLIGATVVAGVAAVLAYLPAWRRSGEEWADPALAYADTPTPPSGVAITVLPPEEPG